MQLVLDILSMLVYWLFCMNKYKIIIKNLADNVWEDEKFLTGGKLFDFSTAQMVKQKMQKMTSSIVYRVCKVEMEQNG